MNIATGLFTGLTSYAVNDTIDVTTSFEVQAVILYEIGGTLDSNNGGFHAAVGFFDAAGNNACVSTDSGDNAATAATASILLSTRCYQRRTNSAGIRGELTGSVPGATGFRLTVNDAFDVGGPRRLGYIAIGGLSTGAKVGTASMPTGTGDFDVTGLGFDSPDCVFFAMASHGNAVGVANTNVGAISFGVWCNAKQAMMAAEVANGAAESADSIWNEANVLGRVDQSGNTLQTAASYVTGITDGFTLNKSAGGSASAFAYLALKGGDMDLTFEAASTSTGAITRNGLAHPVVGVVAFSTLAATASQSSPTANAKLAMGAGVSGSDRRGMGTLATDALDPTDNVLRGTEASLLIEMSRSGADTFAVASDIDLTSVDSDGYTLDQTVAAGSAWRFAVLAFMQPSGGPVYHDLNDIEFGLPSFGGAGSGVAHLAGGGLAR